MFFLFEVYQTFYFIFYFEKFSPFEVSIPYQFYDCENY